MERYQRVFAEINIDFVEENYKNMKAFIGKDKKIMIVIKADAYGHGALPIAMELKKVGMDSIGVATIDEAIELRKQIEDTPILILGHTPKEEFERLISYDITQTIYKYSMAEDLSKVAKRLGKQGKIHVKINTGLMRLGFYPDEASLEDIVRIHELPNISMDGLFTHFAQSDSEDPSFTEKQIRIFEDFIERLKQRGISAPTVHASNSAGYMNFEKAHYNMVRAGISLYGLYPSLSTEKCKLKLKPVLSLKSKVIFLKEVEEGVPISYGGTYVTGVPSKIATISVGYGDGYPRSLSSKGRVLIRGEYAPIVGSVCMDYFMVDVTNIEDVCEGDEVVLIGRQGQNEITVDEIAKIDGTINYEIVCRLGKRIPRIYYKNGAAIERQRNSKC